MTEINPAGTMFVELIAELMDLVADPNVSRIEVAMGSYNLDEHGNRLLVNGKESVALRAFRIGGMHKEVEQGLRAEFDAQPITLLMILWTDRSRKSNSLGVISFDPATIKKVAGTSDYDLVEKSAIEAYRTRQTQ